MNTQVQQFADGKLELAALFGVDAKNAKRMVRYALYLLEEKQALAQAAALAELAASVLPNDVQAQLLYACALARSGKERQALEHYARVAKLEPGNVRAQIDMGEIHLGLGELERAVAHFKRALELDPKGATPAGHRAHRLVIKMIRMGGK